MTEQSQRAATQTFRTARVFDGAGMDGRPHVDRQMLDEREAGLVLAYLEAAPVIHSNHGFGLDRIDPMRGKAVPLTWHTDGSWVWPGSVTYYLSSYALPPDPEFLAHIRRRNFQPTAVDARTRQAAVAAVAGDGSSIDAPIAPPVAASPSPSVAVPPVASPMATPVTGGPTFGEAPSVFHASPSPSPSGSSSPSPFAEQTRAPVGVPPSSGPSSSGPSSGSQVSSTATGAVGSSSGSDDSANFDRLRAVAGELGVPKRAYRIGAGAEGAWSVLREGSKWAVFRTEQGVRHELATFVNSQHATAYLIGQLYLAPGRAEVAPVQPAQSAQSAGPGRGSAGDSGGPSGSGGSGGSPREGIGLGTAAGLAAGTGLVVGAGGAALAGATPGRPDLSTGRYADRGAAGSAPYDARHSSAPAAHSAGSDTGFAPGVNGDASDNRGPLGGDRATAGWADDPTPLERGPFDAASPYDATPGGSSASDTTPPDRDDSFPRHSDPTPSDLTDGPATSSTDTTAAPSIADPATSPTGTTAAALTADPATSPTGTATSPTTDDPAASLTGTTATSPTAGLAASPTGTTATSPTADPAASQPGAGGPIEGDANRPGTASTDLADSALDAGGPGSFAETDATDQDDATVGATSVDDHTDPTTPDAADRHTGSLHGDDSDGPIEAAEGPATASILSGTSAQPSATDERGGSSPFDGPTPDDVGPTDDDQTPGGHHTAAAGAHAAASPDSPEDDSRTSTTPGADQASSLGDTSSTTLDSSRTSPDESRMAADSGRTSSGDTRTAADGRPRTSAGDPTATGHALAAEDRSTAAGSGSTADDTGTGADAGTDSASSAAGGRGGDPTASAEEGDRDDLAAATPPGTPAMGLGPSLGSPGPVVAADPGAAGSDDTDTADAAHESAASVPTTSFDTPSDTASTDFDTASPDTATGTNTAAGTGTGTGERSAGPPAPAEPTGALRRPDRERPFGSTHPRSTTGDRPIGDEPSDGDDRSVGSASVAAGTTPATIPGSAASSVFAPTQSSADGPAGQRPGHLAGSPASGPSGPRTTTPGAGAGPAVHGAVPTAATGARDAATGTSDPATAGTSGPAAGTSGQAAPSSSTAEGEDTPEADDPAQGAHSATGSGTSQQSAQSWRIQPLPGEPPLTLYRDKRMVLLPPGTEIDRYGEDNGNVTYAARTRYPQRSLPTDWNRFPYHAYRVKRPVEALTGLAVPWFEQPGGGTAFVLSRSIAELVSDGSLVEIEDPAPAPS